MPPSINCKIAVLGFLNQGGRASTNFAQLRNHCFFFPQQLWIDRDGRFHPNHANLRQRKRQPKSRQQWSRLGFFVKIRSAAPITVRSMLIT